MLRPRLYFVLIIVFVAAACVVNDWLFGKSSLPEPGWRYFLLPLLAVLTCLHMGAVVVRRLYNHPGDITGYGMAFRFMVSSAFGIFLPSLEIQEGKAIEDQGQMNIPNQIVGPGYLLIPPGTLVLLENYASIEKPLRICQPGRRFVDRFERVREVISTRELSAEEAEIQAISKDGLMVYVRNVRYRYRLLGSALFVDTAQLNPQMEEAIYNKVYNSTNLVNPKTKLEAVTPWNMNVGFTVAMVITDYINRHSIDDLTAPSGENPREAILELFRTEDVRKRVEARGGELIMVDIGEFVIPEAEVAQQRVNNWRAKWIGNADVERSYGEALRQAHQQLARAEGQAEMIMNILHALSQIEMQGQQKTHLRTIILMRTAQLLEALGEQMKLPKQAGQA